VRKNQEMVKFIYEPWKTVVIHEIVQYDLQMLIHLHGLGVQPGQLGSPIRWANGVAFDIVAMKHTDEVINEQIKGKIHWSGLTFAFMPQHQQIIEIPEGKIRIPILNLSDNVLFRELAEWIKSQFKP
jgi:hypothetical protein